MFLELKKRKNVITLLLVIMFAGVIFSANACKKYSFYSPQEDVYILKLDAVYAKDNLFPYVSDGLVSAKTAAQVNNAKIAVNTGFFDPKNKKTTSYVTQNGKFLANPLENEDLMTNAAVAPYIDAILNRSEFRAVKCSDKTYFDIALHNTSVDSDCSILFSMQAGPMLLPQLKLQEESFVLEQDGKIVRNSASALNKAARTAVAIKGNDIFFIIAGNSSSMTLNELSEFMNNEIKPEKAMAFDGGSSTQMYVDGKVYTFLGDGGARRVKSFFLLK